MARPSRFSPEVRDRAVRMVLEHENEHASQWAAITSIAEKIGCAAETLRSWVRQAERDQGKRPGLTTEERQGLKQLERENVDEILKKAAAYFAQAELSGEPGAVQDNWNQGPEEIKFGNQTTSTSKMRRVDFGDCGPPQPPKAPIGGRK